jgi:hypothetical protein
MSGAFRVFTLAAGWRIRWLRRDVRPLLVTFLLQYLDCALHNLLLIPMDAFEGCSDPSLGIEDVSFNPVSVYQRFDKIDPELEVATKCVDTVDRPQHPMVAIHSYVTVFAITAKTFGKIEGGVVRNRRSVYLIADSPHLQQFLNPRELRDRQRALQRIVAARIEKNDNRGISSEEFLEGDRGAVVILENRLVDRLRGAKGKACP